MDIFRPRFSLTVHAYRMPLSDGDILVSAKLLRSEEEGTVLSPPPPVYSVRL